MRPDEHKKKKNALYKKKHGIQTDQKQGAFVKEEDTACVRGRFGASRQATSQTPKPTKLCTAADPPYVQYGNEESSSVYRRRKVESNWEKYEQDVDNEEVMCRGADFEQLLQSARHVKPQFQFSATHDILGGCEETLVASCDQTNLLSVDCERLAAALRCIPVWQRLDIDESLFEKSHIELLQKEAEHNRLVYEKAFGISAKRAEQMDKHHISNLQPVLACTSDELSVVPDTVVSKDVEKNLPEVYSCDEEFKLIPGNDCGNSPQIDPGDHCDLPCDVNNGFVSDSVVVSSVTECTSLCGDKLDTEVATGTLPCTAEFKPPKTNILLSPISNPRTKTILELEDELESLLAL